MFDRKTGELINVSLGDWITITELGQRFDCGPKKTRTVLREMDFLQVEGDGRSSRHRLCHWVVERGWGHRLTRKKDKRKSGNIPFDTIGPDARQWVEERWAAAFQAVEHRTKTGPAAKAKAALEGFQISRNRMNS